MGLVIEGVVSAALLGVGAEAANAGHVQLKPQAAFPAGSVVGHFRAQNRFNLNAGQVAATQSAGRMLHLRNGGGNLVVVTRLRLVWTQTALYTAAIRAELALVKAYTSQPTAETGATAATIVPKRGQGVLPPGGSTAVVWYANTVGPSGMTGQIPLPSFEGPSATPVNLLSRAEMWLLAAMPTDSMNQTTTELLDDVQGTHPIVLAQNESLMLMNMVATGAAGTSSVLFDLSWAEVKAF